MYEDAHVRLIERKAAEEDDDHCFLSRNDLSKPGPALTTVANEMLNSLTCIFFPFFDSNFVITYSMKLLL